MDFFRSILSDEPEPEESDNYEEFETDPRPNQSPKYEETNEVDDDSGSDPITPEDDDGGNGGGLWSFGGLVKTLTSRSESVLETYRRDLKEFGSGLRKESDLFREVASRAVKELPSSIEVGASAIDGVLKSTADIISQGKDALLAPSDVDDSDTSEPHNYTNANLNSRRYSRFDSQLHVIQNDTRTYCEDPEDLDDYNKWKLGFVLGDKKEEIENLVGDNGALEGVYQKLVPNEVEDGTFWFRYFYRVHKLKQQEDMRANLVKRSLSVDDEEELSWDVDDDEEEEANQAVKPDSSNSKVFETEKKEGSVDSSNNKELHGTDEKKGSSNDESQTESSKVVDVEKEKNDESKTEISMVVDEEKEKKADVDGSVDKTKLDEQKPSAGNVSDTKVESVKNSDEKVDHNVESGKDSDMSVVSTQPPTQDDDDLEWDEIEDLGSSDEKKLVHGEPSNKDKADLRKRLSTAEDDEDLSWDIEDDEEPVKAGTK